ncbi:MAG: hypothetical protein JWN04_3107, partial [Myxococcaceae bacterium]|nr:hypothetical protein [Myxococcaceae bacterium]
MVVRQGDALRLLDSQTELLSLLGAIDTPAEALFLAAVSGATLCPGGVTVTNG